ncbi:metal tolerance protein B-like [Rutidosis leptorrhynchoides]|uniref:metal tolerance protein B-like n=1 Tax=Rutidosis leptorrhynchoides TaxID=125765 RepID=UPI003A99F5EA
MPNASVVLSPEQSCNCSCYFSNQKHNVSDTEQRSKSKTKLCGLVVFYLIVMAVEIVGGIKANSLAVLTDAAHLLTDIGGFVVSLFTLWASGWKPTAHQSFGFSRIEVLGALLSVQLIWIVSGYLIYEAVERIIHKESEVDGKLMFPIAVFGFVINFIMVMWLGHGHGHNHGHGHDHNHSQDEKKGPMNIIIEGAYLHVMADMIQSAGVMGAGIVIWVKPTWLVVDLGCTVAFSVLAQFVTLPMLRNVFSILMERTPSDFNVVGLRNDLNGIKGVHDVHDLHVWAITQGKNVLSCHTVIEPNVNPNEILHKIKELCEGTYGIHHVTVQIEILCPNP